jgi:hypothetical protein
VGSPRTLVSGADSCADGVALFSLVVAAMAWVPRGPESAGQFMAWHLISSFGGCPNDFKSWRAVHQKGLSGGTNRPIVEKAAF